MAYYKICPKCGANLDPSEVCDCEKKTIPIKLSPKGAAWVVLRKAGLLDSINDPKFDSIWSEFERVLSINGYEIVERRQVNL